MVGGGVGAIKMWWEVSPEGGGGNFPGEKDEQIFGCWGGLPPPIPHPLCRENLQTTDIHLT